jgi:hypothetical protein
MAVEPPSYRHSLAISNCGTELETAMGESVAMIAIGRCSNIIASLLI